VATTEPSRKLGRYALHGVIASGGMAVVHFGRLLGPVGFARTVAIKRLHPHLAADPEFATMFLDEARLAARIRHPNVVQTLDVVASEGELFLVMDYVLGESLGHLLRAASGAGRPPFRILSAIVSDLLHGLHAAHEATNERGEPLGLVHRDVSPQNAMVGVDGVSRVLDFGVAKANGQLRSTQEGRLKGKLSYMSPEQLSGAVVSRRTDIYAASVVLWEAMTGKRLFTAENEGELVARVLEARVDPPSYVMQQALGSGHELDPTQRQELESLDAIVLRGLAHDPGRRFQTAREMVVALERVVPPATKSEVGEWVERLASKELAARLLVLSEIEREAAEERSIDRALADESIRKGASTRPNDVSTPFFVAAVGSQVSSLSVSTPKGPTSASSSKRSLGLILALVVGVGIVVGVARVTSERRNVVSDRAASSAATPPLVEAVDGAPKTTALERDSSSTAAPSVETTGDKDAAPVAPTLRPNPRPHKKESSGSTPTPAAAAPTLSVTPSPRPAAPNCDPPYTLDSAGITHYKPQCLQPATPN
jgi:eukaryotic-like serine/threonine-protein kinase